MDKLVLQPIGKAQEGVSRGGRPFAHADAASGATKQKTNTGGATEPLGQGGGQVVEGA